MEKEQAIKESLGLVERAPIILLGTIDENGYPNIKAMLACKHEGLHTFLLSTNTSSKRVTQIKRNPKTSLYFFEDERTGPAMAGLVLVGTTEVLQDHHLKELLWQPGNEQYYPQGVTDPDYSVLRFTAQWGNYYRALSNATFEVTVGM